MSALSRIGEWIVALGWGGKPTPSTRELARALDLSPAEADRLLYEPDAIRAGGHPTSDAILGWLTAQGIRKPEDRQRKLLDLLHVLGPAKLRGLAQELIDLHHRIERKNKSLESCLARISDIVGAGDEQSAVLSMRMWAEYQTESKIRRALLEVADAIDDHNRSVNKK